MGLLQLVSRGSEPPFFSSSVVEASLLVLDPDTADWLLTAGKDPFDHTYRLICCDLLLLFAGLLCSGTIVDSSALTLFPPVMPPVLAIHSLSLLQLRDLFISCLQLR